MYLYINNKGKWPVATGWSNRWHFATCSRLYNGRKWNNEVVQMTKEGKDDEQAIKKQMVLQHPIK